MKKLSWVACCFVLALAANACHQESGGAHVGEHCKVNSDCNDGVNMLICANGICIGHCQQVGCQGRKVCAETGICVDPVIEDDRECHKQKPCTDAGKVCSGEFVCVTGECSSVVPCGEGKVCKEESHLCVECLSNLNCNGDKVCSLDNRCVECVSNDDCGVLQQCNSKNQCESVDGCKPGSCPAGQVCAQDGVCFEGECSVLDACPVGKLCQDKKCIVVSDYTCYADADCGPHMGCDQNKCVPEDACSMTRTCPSDQVCKAGTCVAKSVLVCTKDSPCPNASDTCVAGKCVACSCKDDESCMSDGTCVKTEHSALKDINVGEECVYSADFSFCDGNRRFSCISPAGSDKHFVEMEDCGAKVCATAPEQGVGCYEPCDVTQNAEFYGVCIEGWGEKISFTHECSLTPEGVHIWSLQHGYQDCEVDCNNGRCSFVPPEFKENCTTATYPDACQGDWLTYCYSTSSSPAYGGIKLGTACSTLGPDAFCALPSQRALKYDSTIVASCVYKCSEPGAKTNYCVRDEDGVQYSDAYICAPTEDGRLGDFLVARTPCSGKCDENTGLCK